MFASISLAIRQFFGMWATLFSAGEHAAKAVEALAITAEETAGQFCDEARSKRAIQNRALDAELVIADTNAVKSIKAAA